MAYIKKIRFDRVDNNSGCTCDRCGQYIRNIWSVTYTDDVTMHFGIDCFEKLSKASKLNAYGMKTLRKALKSIETYSDILKDWESGTITEECGEWKNEQDERNKNGYWYGRSFEEYREFMINEWIPARLANAQKEIDRFSKVNFKRND